MSYKHVIIILLLAAFSSSACFADDLTTDDVKFIEIINSTQPKLEKLATSLGESAKSQDLPTIRSASADIFDFSYSAKSKIKPLNVSSQYVELKTDYLKMLTDYNDAAFTLKNAMDIVDPFSSNGRALDRVDFAFKKFASGDEMKDTCTRLIIELNLGK